MKKIGILTFHNSVNNGAVMQAYSLSRKLQECFPACKVEIIDYHMPKVVEAYRHNVWKDILCKNPVLLAKRLVRLCQQPGRLRKLNRRSAVFAACRDRLPLSDFSLLSDDTQELFEHINKTYDILVVGSDAVWNYTLRGFPNAYFPDSTVTCTKMSCAASCYGMEFLNISQQVRQVIGKTLEDFSFLGVRDSATEDFVRWSGCRRETAHVCDPTMFLNVEALPVDRAKLEEKLKKKGFDFNRPTIGMMGSSKILKLIRRMYGAKYQIAALYEPTAGADVDLYDLTPYEWAYVFRYFKVTFTTFFHGTLLSLRNGVPVICTALQSEFAKNHIPKTLDVLQRLGYEDWYFETDYLQQNVDAIRHTADRFLSTDLKAEILQRVEQEAQTFEVFRSALEGIMEEKNNG